MERTRRQFIGERGMIRGCQRSEQIDRLPRVQWKGRTLYTLRCRGEYGNGPHDLNVPESLLWALISLEHFVCPYHR